MLKRIKQLFCKHEYEICTNSLHRYYSLKGVQLYRVCKKCGRIEKYIYLEYEGNGYK